MFGTISFAYGFTISSRSTYEVRLQFQENMVTPKINQSSFSPTNSEYIDETYNCLYSKFKSVFGVS